MNCALNARRSRERGFTLLEVLVSLLILVIGLLGLIGLQAQAQIATFESYQRGQALIMVQDMADRIATNRGAANCYVITTDTANGTPYLGTGYSGTPVCTAAVGTAATRAVADSDLQAWNNALQGAAETSGIGQIGGVLGARGCVSFDAATNSYRVAVAWQGSAATVAPTAGDAAATCGKNLYGSDAQRREVSVTVRIATLT
ncbi:MAG: type IV pilus modification protein PilV [Betaproteobacteria bacterium]|nr:type IV pilus modification protein PilV [Betaproteobacteria bacterium]